MAEVSAQAVKALRDRTGAGMMDCKRALGEAGGDLDKAIEVLRERGLAKAGKRSGRATSEGSVAMALGESGGALIELACETDFVAKTPNFQKLVSQLVGTVLADAGCDSVDALLDSELEGEKVRDLIAAMIARIGENIVVKRLARLAPNGSGQVGGYVHAGGKLGVLVALDTESTGERVSGLAKDLAMHVAAVDPTPLSVDRDGVPGDLLDKERLIFRRQAEQDGKPEKIIDRIVEGRVKKFYSEICLLEQAFVKDPDHSIREVLDEAGKQLGSELGVSGFVRFKLGEVDTE